MSIVVDGDTMPAISITDDQHERLRRLQRRLGEDVDYGHVRPRDALEYLLDQFDGSNDVDDGLGEPEIAGETAQPDATAADETLDSAPSTVGDQTTYVVAGGGAVDDAPGSGDTLGTDDAGAVESTDGDDAIDEEEARTDEATDGDGTNEGGVNEGVNDDETRLNSMMSLLADHDDKWRETNGGEEKYEVDLPDGGTERARTKDDVRAILFKHHR
jgi:hypothetical protein